MPGAHLGEQLNGKTGGTLPARSNTNSKLLVRYIDDYFVNHLSRHDKESLDSFLLSPAPRGVAVHSSGITAMIYQSCQGVMPHGQRQAINVLH
ncbi:unnamed protein product [Protopolystoma xenopodis]|uniref:Uncharacterized protein n=1 Tax=Protopolystoma xenopodis TaxID=117903 RepID=A0A448XAY6_9PLAT|nr:unnamed protein product [Protopolystoma xenopodis]